MKKKSRTEGSAPRHRISQQKAHPEMPPESPDEPRALLYLPISYSYLLLNLFPIILLFLTTKITTPTRITIPAAIIALCGSITFIILRSPPLLFSSFLKYLKQPLHPATLRIITVSLMKNMPACLRFLLLPWSQSPMRHALRAAY